MFRAIVGSLPAPRPAPRRCDGSARAARRMGSVGLVGHRLDSCGGVDLPEPDNGLDAGPLRERGRRPRRARAFGHRLGWTQGRECRTSIKPFTRSIGSGCVVIQIERNSVVARQICQSSTRYQLPI